MKETLLEFMEHMRPFECFALARTRELRKRARRLTRAEISKRSGLPLRSIDRITQKLSWKGVKIESASAFLVGCGSDIFDGNVDRNYLRRALINGGKIPHLTESQMKSLNQKLQRLQMMKGMS